MLADIIVKVPRLSSPRRPKVLVGLRAHIILILLCCRCGCCCDRCRYCQVAVRRRPLASRCTGSRLRHVLTSVAAVYS